LLISKPRCFTTHYVGLKNDLDGAAFAFGSEPPHNYCGAPIHADFDLTLENLAPYTTRVLDLAAPLEGAVLEIKLIEIKMVQ
jgi:hypothetical protein